MSMSVKNIAETADWAKGGGLLPAIVQDRRTARVLMLGYMNREALEQTAESGKVTFFSRSKNRLWVKGETSGNFLLLDDIRLDCDNDTLLVTARAEGPACHKGTETCFGAQHAPDFGFLGSLEDIIALRAKADPSESYVAKLLAKGLPKAAQKVGEEGVETALAAVLPSEEDFKNEAADLVFHLLVLLKAKGLALRDIAAVLEQRHAIRAPQKSG
jgi:phosphoribosyl-ATP pyrophosphohydrolase/phosphoribosyl-AMP cyclohydrolase